MSSHILVMQMVLSITSLQSLGHNDQNEVKIIFQSCDAISTSIATM